MQNVLYYFIAVSVIGAVVCIYDKHRNLSRNRIKWLICI